MKRAYAVVRESPDGLLCLNFEGWQESVALFRSGLKKDERVEIRLRVAQGEDAVRKALTLAMRWMEDENAGPVAPVLAAIDAALAAAPEEPVLGGNPRNHLLGCAYKNKPSLGVAACDCGAYSPPAAPEEHRECMVTLPLVRGETTANYCGKPMPCKAHPAAHEEQEAPRGVCRGLADLHEKNADCERWHLPDEPSDEEVAEARAATLSAPPFGGLVVCDNPSGLDGHKEWHPLNEGKTNCVNPRLTHPVDVVCGSADFGEHEAGPHVQTAMCLNPRPAHPPAARTETEICLVCGSPRCTTPTLKQAAPPSPETTFKRQPNGMLTATPPDNAAAFAASHARSATPELAPNVVPCTDCTKGQCNYHRLYPVDEPVTCEDCLDPDGDPHERQMFGCKPPPAPSATPEPEKLGEGPMAKAERRGCKIGGEP